jgi:hypothetical protein
MTGQFHTFYFIYAFTSINISHYQPQNRQIGAKRAGCEACGAHAAQLLARL